MTYIHAPVNVILPRSNGITVELGNPERVVPIPSGAQGLQGEPGFSPVVSVEPITGGNRVTITDADGDTSFDVMNGAQGEQGEPGEGVPAGGAQGQVLKKASNADFDTFWANESGVLSVNGQTGDVVLPIPTKTSDLTNDSGFVDASGASSAAPVQSVNGQTGNVQTITLLDVYPVGSIYMSVNATSPATLFGGTWEQIKDTFLLSAGDTYTAGDTGGEAEHTLTVDEMPSHGHDVNTTHAGTGCGFYRTNASGGSSWAMLTGGRSGSMGYPYAANTGGGQAHNNMPPFLAVYVWKRTA